ncbi:unnamed protein product [Allacma fusca]|uniref:Phospholipid scramblase n=1 Tax=Allacma fusca TaxID=39272 RepID=A0A8J2M6F3_9HEXA|nr:unnamed protein product [Allacma fusca]
MSDEFVEGITTPPRKDWLESRKSIGAQILHDFEKDNVSQHLKRGASYQTHIIMGNWSYIPPGLDILREYQSLQVRQQRDTRSNITLNVEMSGYSRRNSYDIFDEFQHRIMHVSEQTETDLMRKGNKRKYTFSVRGSEGNELFKFRRERSCCGDAIECMVADGSIIGGVRSGCSCFFCTSYIDVFEGRLGYGGPSVLLIEDRGWCNREFAVVDPADKSQVIAYITKRFEDASMEGYDDADVYLVEFKGTHEMNPIYKTILIGAVFFLDFKYFEETRSKREGRNSKSSGKLDPNKGSIERRTPL